MQIFIIYTVLILHFVLSVVSVKLSPCARWNTTGITVAGTGKSGNSAHQLKWPRGIFIHRPTNTLYVADEGNSRIQRFSLDNLTTVGVTVANLIQPAYFIYVDDDDDGPTVYASITYGSRVEKWVNGASSGKIVGGPCSQCTGISVDQEKNIYMTSSDRCRVLKWSRQANKTTIVAGVPDDFDSTNNPLMFPQGIYFDRNTSSVYVADYIGKRVQKWLKGAEEGIIVAGSNVVDEAENDATLGTTQSVVVDEETEIVYVVDVSRARIHRWLPGASKGDTIVGGRGSGDASDQFSSPQDLAFDNESNLYVSDRFNHRVQFFALLDNQPCSATSTTTPAIEITKPTQPSSSPTTTTMITTTTTTTTTVITTATATTTARSDAVSSQWNRHSSATAAVRTLSIVLWMNTLVLH